MITVNFHFPPSLQGKGKIQKINQNKNSILLESGKSLHESLVQWFTRLNATSKSNHFSPKKINQPEVINDTVKVGIGILGITRALHDITILPRESKALAIPVDPSAKHTRPREYNIRYKKGHKKALFLYKPKNGGDAMLARNDGKKLIMMYVLKSKVHQNQDRNLLPSDQTMNNALIEGAKRAMMKILNQ